MTLKWSALVTAALGLAITGGAAEAQTKLKWAHVYETSEPFHTQSVWAAQELAKRTNNRYQVDVYPASQLGKETDLNQGLSLGSVDIIVSGSSFAARSSPPIGVTQTISWPIRRATCSRSSPRATRIRPGTRSSQ
jgi:TRAP-type C4-dicarboxylate transport system substrate-binding protein